MAIDLGHSPRQGRGTAEPTGVSSRTAEMMVGREVALLVDKASLEVGDVVLDVRGVTVVDPRGHQVARDALFDARAGEVLGIAGVRGNGQTELIKALLGLIKPDAGAIFLEGRDISRHRRVLDDGIGYIPEDRSHDGYVGAFTVRENLVLDLTAAWSSPADGAAPRRDFEKNADARIEQFDIRTSSRRPPRSPLLSGGTSRRSSWHGSSPGPSRCSSPPSADPRCRCRVDRVHPHKRIIEERDKGIGRDHRVHRPRRDLRPVRLIVVMYDGRIVATVTPDIAREDIGLMMAGAHEPAEEISA